MIGSILYLAASHTVVFDILKIPVLSWLGILVLTRLGMLMIEKTLMVGVFILVWIWLHGWVKNKIQFHFQLSKLSTLQLGVALHNCYGWNRSWRTMAMIRIAWQCSMTIHMLSTSLRIMFNNLRPSMLISIITSFIIFLNP